MNKVKKAEDEFTMERLKEYVRNYNEAKERNGRTQFFKNGRKIHIKESQKGSFTRYCGGNVTQECINRAKASGNSRLVKKATFAENARKWKHQYGGVMTSIQPDFNDAQTDFNNIHIDEESLNPYGSYTFGLRPQTEWYAGNKGGGNAKWDHDLNTVSTIYKQLQTAIQKYYPKYNQNQVDNLADYMTRHYVKENGWNIVHYAVGGYGTVRTVDEWVNKMKPTYPNAMRATNYNEYVEGLKSNYQGNKYNSANPNYYKEMTRDFGPNTRVDRMLKQIRGIK